MKKLYSDDDVFDFGKYKGKTIAYIKEKDSNYINWCLENIESFYLDETEDEDINQEDYYKLQQHPSDCGCSECCPPDRNGYNNNNGGCNVCGADYPETNDCCS